MLSQQKINGLLNSSTPALSRARTQPVRHGLALAPMTIRTEPPNLNLIIAAC